MKIKNENRKRVQIEKVPCGECFYVENQLYMKINNTDNDSKEFTNSAVNLLNNTTNAFMDGKVVEMVKAKIVID